MFICVPTTYASVWHDSWMYLTCFTWICHTVYVYVIIIMTRWFMMHSWMCMTYFTWHVSLICVACQTCQCDLWMCVISHESVWFIKMYDMFHKPNHDSTFINESHWFMMHSWMCMTCFTWHVFLICVAYFMNVCDMSHPWVWHDSWIFVTRPDYLCGMTHECVTRLIDMRYIGAHRYLLCWHVYDPLTRLAFAVYMYDVTHSYVCDTSHF